MKIRTIGIYTAFLYVRTRGKACLFIPDFSLEKSAPKGSRGKSDEDLPALRSNSRSHQAANNRRG